MHDCLTEVFQQSFRELRPRSELPELRAEFFSFANVNSTIRLRQGKLLVRVSDLLEGAPEPVLRAIAHILLAKMDHNPIGREPSVLYRRYISSPATNRHPNLVGRMRGRKHLPSPQGGPYDL